VFRTVYRLPEMCPPRRIGDCAWITGKPEVGQRAVNLTQKSPTVTLARRSWASRHYPRC